MAKSILQKFFDEFDKNRDPDSPPRLSGITNYLFDLGKTSSSTLQRSSALENPLRGFGFFAIDELYKNQDPIYILLKKMIDAVVRRVKLEKNNKRFVIFGEDTLRSFLELMLIYFGSNRNISDLEKKLSAIYTDILSFLVFGKARKISNLKEEAYIIGLKSFDETIDKIFGELARISCDGAILLSFIFICSERIKEQDDEDQFAEELMAEEQDVERRIDKKLAELLKQKIEETFPKPKPLEEEASDSEEASGSKETSGSKKT